MTTKPDQTPQYGRILLGHTVPDENGASEVTFDWTDGIRAYLPRYLVTLADRKYIALDLKNRELKIGPFKTRIVRELPDGYEVERLNHDYD